MAKSGKHRKQNAVKGDPVIPVGPPPTPNEQELTLDERRFVDEWLIDRQVTCAFMRANPTCESWRSGRQQGQAIANRPHVRLEMRAAAHAQSIRTQVRADGVLKEIARIANSDILDLFDPQTNQLRGPRYIPIDTRRCVASVKVSRSRETTRGTGTTTTRIVDTVIEYKLWPKNDALGKLANYLGLNTAIPPIEAFLAALPPLLAKQVREAMAEHVRSLNPEQTHPSTNGNGRH